MAREFKPQRISCLPNRLRPGEGWQIRCPHCSQRGRTLEGGVCRSCGKPALPDGCSTDLGLNLRPRFAILRFLVLTILKVVGPPLLVYLAWFLLFCLYYFNVTWTNLLGVPVAGPSTEHILRVEVMERAWLCTVGLFLVGAPGTIRLFWRVRDSILKHWRRDFPARGVAPDRMPRIKLRTHEVDLGSGALAAILSVTVKFSTSGFDGEKAILSLRLRGPDGYYVGGAGDGVVGMRGETLVQAATRQLYGYEKTEETLSAGLNLWKTVLPRNGEKNGYQVEAILSANDLVLVEQDLPLQFCV